MNKWPLWCGLFALVFWSSHRLSAQELEKQLLRRLTPLDLTKKTRSELEALVRSRAPKIEKQQQRGQCTKDQRELRRKAYLRAIEEKKKGKAVNIAVSTAAPLTPEQKKARAKASKLTRELNREILKHLPDSQKKKFLDGPPPNADKYSGHLIIRLSSKIDIPDDSKTLDEVAKEKNLDGLGRVLAKYGLGKATPGITSIPRPLIRKLEERAKNSKLPPLRSLTAYWRIPLTDQQKKNTKEMLAELKDLDSVDRAYLELRGRNPSVHPEDDDYNEDQEYQDPATDGGIDARYFWKQPNGQGAGVGLVDMEREWLLDHEDYVCKAPHIVFGDNYAEFEPPGDHGTQVLGVIVGVDNERGIVGIAPSTAYVSLVSRYNADTDSGVYAADAIAAAIPIMREGDVLLLEHERGAGVPTEVDDLTFDAIRLASTSGFVVVEAAGNAKNSDLDEYTSDGKKILNPKHGDFRESGAILVGAGTSSPPHNRIGQSSFGSRVNCYAWGDSIVTTGKGGHDSGGGNVTKEYHDDFGYTSGATAIIAGAAILVQGAYKAKHGKPLTSMEMRDILGCKDTGTAQGTGTSGNIGYMPDLRKVHDKHFAD